MIAKAPSEANEDSSLIVPGQEEDGRILRQTEDQLVLSSCQLKTLTTPSSFPLALAIVLHFVFEQF